MISVRHLGGMRQRTAYGVCIGAGTISADDVDLWMLLEPRENCLSGAIGQEVEWPVRLEVDKNGSIAVPTSEREVIDPQHAHGSIGRRRDRSQVAQQGWCLHLHPQSWSQPFAHLSTRGQPKRFQLLQQAVGHPCPGLDKLRKALAENAAWTGERQTAELAHMQL